MLEELGAYCTETIRRLGCPSVSVAVAERGELVLAEAYGLADPATGRPATPATAYGLASVTKPVTATAVCVAADEGLLDLDAPLPGGFPGGLADDPSWPSPTPRQLLRHRGGFGAHYAFDYGDGGRRIDSDRYARLYREPGTGFEYANTGYRLLGLLLEQATGRDLGTFARERVFAPLGLTGCHLGPSYPGPAPSAVRFTPDGRPYPDADCDHPGATLGWAPAGELALFAQSYPRLLKPETAAAMLDEQPVHDHLGYGLGWCVSRGAGPRVVSHGGGMGGVAAMAVAVPAQELSVAVLANSTNKAARDAIVRYVLTELVPGYTDDHLTVFRDTTRPTEMPPGEWAGRIVTPEGEVPVSLRLLADRQAELRMDGESATAPVTASATADLRAVFPLVVPTDDARAGSTVTGLELRADEGRLKGVARACKEGDREGFLGNMLSHPCELRPR